MATPAKTKPRRRTRRGRRPTTRTVPVRLTFTERMQRLDAKGDVLKAVLLRGDTPRAKWVMAQWAIAGYETRFNETKDPVFVWLALHTALAAGDPVPSWAVVPAWVIAYVHRVASNVHEMVFSKIPARDIPPAVYRALEFTPARRKNPFRVFADEQHDRNIAYVMMPQILAGKKLDGVINEVVNEHPTVCGTMQYWMAGNRKCQSISRSTVARIWRKHGPTLLAQCEQLDLVNARLDERRRQGRHLDDSMTADVSEHTTGIFTISDGRRRRNLK